jgi:hypothetical protein
MINNQYSIDLSWNESGGYCDFFLITNNPDIGFKAFKKKNKAEQSLQNQKLLSEFDLAPMPISEICKIPFDYGTHLLEYYEPKELYSSWGYLTEKASIIDYSHFKRPYLSLIQKLVDEIYAKTKLKFWDCHEHNIGYIKRERKKKLVCIDTGAESFAPYSNAWGFPEPGPKCCYCNRYQCICTED